MYPTILSRFEISIDVDRIVWGQGIDPAGASPRILSWAQEIIPLALSLFDPAAAYLFLPIKERHRNRVLLDKNILLEGQLLSRPFDGATKTALGICTIGPKLDEKVSAMFNNKNAAKALALEGAGIAALEEVSRVLVDEISHVAGACGLATGTSISPGQEGWPLEQQQIIFKLLSAQNIGVQLTESGIMLPRKSISFVLPLGTDLCSDKTYCDFCSKHERCPWSKTRAGKLK